MEPTQDRKKMYEELTYGFPSRAKKKKFKQQQRVDDRDTSMSEVVSSQENIAMNQTDFKTSVDQQLNESVLPPRKDVHQEVTAEIEEPPNDVVRALFSEDAHKVDSFDELERVQSEFSAYDRFLAAQNLKPSTDIEGQQAGVQQVVVEDEIQETPAIIHVSEVKEAIDDDTLEFVFDEKTVSREVIEEKIVKKDEQLQSHKQILESSFEEQQASILGKETQASSQAQQTEIDTWSSDTALYQGNHAEDILNQLYEFAITDKRNVVEEKDLTKTKGQETTETSIEFAAQPADEMKITQQASLSPDEEFSVTFMPRGTVTRMSKTSKAKKSKDPHKKRSKTAKKLDEQKAELTDAKKEKRKEKNSIPWAFLLSVLFGLIIVIVLVVGIWFLSKENSETEEQLPIQSVQIDNGEPDGTQNEQNLGIDNEEQATAQNDIADQSGSSQTTQKPQQPDDGIQVVDGIRYKIEKHIVQNNENLTSISKKYFGTTVGIDLIYQWNQLESAVIHKGQILEVPIPVQ